jgi:hypothetical protein
MTLTVADCAALNMAIYGLAPPITWDFYDSGAKDDGVCWGIKRFDDAVVVCLRGSVTIEDWFRDALAIVKPWGHPGLGPVHPGFYLGMTQVWAELKAGVPATDRIIVTGHSLGGARAAILAGLMALDGRPPAARVCFGEPKPGFQALADITKDVPTLSYRNSDGDVNDIVTHGPLTVPPEEYVHQTKLIDQIVPTSGWPAWGPFRLHHCQLYADAAPDTVVI